MIGMTALHASHVSLRWHSSPCHSDLCKKNSKLYGNMGNTLEAETKQFDGVVKEVIL